MFHTDSISRTEQIISMNSLIRIQNAVFYAKSGEPDEIHSDKTPYPTQSSSVKSKVRYVGGMCVGKILFPQTQYLTRHCYDQPSQWEEKKKSVTVLHNHIYPSLSIAKTISTMPDTFHEIDHRQTIYGHLTIIDDALLQMFLKYDEIIHAYLTRDKITEWKVSFFWNVLHKSLDELYADQHLTIPSDMSPAIFKLLAIRYLKVSMKELKFKLMTKEKIKKSAAHRKAILMTESHVEDGPASKKSKTVEEIPVSTQPTPSTSEVQDSDETDCLCSVCDISYSSTYRLQWIECEKCKKWLHRKCDKSLRSHKLWKKLRANEKVYMCPQCKWIKQYCSG